MGVWGWATEASAPVASWGATLGSPLLPAVKIVFFSQEHRQLGSHEKEETRVKRVTQSLESSKVMAVKCPWLKVLQVTEGHRVISAVSSRGQDVHFLISKSRSKQVPILCEWETAVSEREPPDKCVFWFMLQTIARQKTNNCIQWNDWHWPPDDGAEKGHQIICQT